MYDGSTTADCNENTGKERVWPEPRVHPLLSARRNDHVRRNRRKRPRRKLSAGNKPPKAKLPPPDRLPIW